MINSILTKTSPFIEKDLRHPSGYQVEMCNPFRAAATVYQVAILKDVFRLSDRQVIDSIVEAHSSTKSVVFIGTREIAEMRTVEAEKMRQQYIPMNEVLKKIGFIFKPM